MGAGGAGTEGFASSYDIHLVEDFLEQLEHRNAVACEFGAERLRHLEQENGRLKRLVADRDLELQVLKEISRKKW